MRYLKLYESMSQDEVKDKFSPIIGWGHIEDIKELSLEYLDYNYKLEIEIHYENTTILYIQYSHAYKEENWQPHVPNGYKNSTLNPHKIEYEISLHRPGKATFYGHVPYNYDDEKTTELLARCNAKY